MSAAGSKALCDEEPTHLAAGLGFTYVDLDTPMFAAPFGARPGTWSIGSAWLTSHRVTASTSKGPPT
jgi:hypothetical protein